MIMSLRSNSNTPLPQCEGPKLLPFRNRDVNIGFKRLLSDPDAEGQAHVFEVSINSTVYALKMFKFYNDEEDTAGLDDSETDLIPIDLLHAHMDPFYNECRAFGRVMEANLNGKIAVHCYGYIIVPADKEEELERDFGVNDWNRPEVEYAKPSSQRQSFRAIVKELIHHDPPFTAKLLKKTLRDLKKIRRLGVYPMDVQARNYKDGLLLDMSVAMTKPHFLFDIKPEWQVSFFKRNDLIQWEKMVRDAGILVWKRALRNKDYCAKLRSAGSLEKAKKL